MHRKGVVGQLGDEFIFTDLFFFIFIIEHEPDKSSMVLVFKKNLIFPFPVIPRYIIKL